MRKSAVTAYRFAEANIGNTVTPGVLNKRLNVGSYASRAIWILQNRLGVTVETVKDGRKVKGYTFVAMPDETPREIVDTEAKLKARKVKSAAKASKAAAAKRKAEREATAPVEEPVEDVTETVEATVEAEPEVTNEPDVPFVDEDFDEVSAEELAASI